MHLTARLFGKTLESALAIFQSTDSLAKKKKKCLLLHFKSIWFLLICGFTKQSGI